MMTRIMHDKSIWLVFLLIALCPTFTSATAESTMRLYNVKEGQITYQLTGSQTGTETFYFTDYGNKTRRETHAKMEMGGFTQQTNTVILTDGPWMYTLDPVKKEATKQKNPMYGSIEEQGNPTRIKLGEDLMKAMGGTVTGKDKVLGQACDIWEVKHLMATTCITGDWFAVWTKSGTGGMELRETATVIKIGPVPAGITSLPAGTRVVEGADPLQSLKQFQQQDLGQSPTRKKRSQPLTQKQMEEAASMQERFQGKDLKQMMEELKKMQAPHKGSQ